jgi:hypothetical protein
VLRVQNRALRDTDYGDDAEQQSIKEGENQDEVVSTVEIEYFCSASFGRLRPSFSVGNCKHSLELLELPEEARISANETRVGAFPVSEGNGCARLKKKSQTHLRSG